MKKAIDTDQAQDLSGQALERMVHEGDVPESNVVNQQAGRVIDQAGEDSNVEVRDGGASVRVRSNQSFDFTVGGVVPYIQQTDRQCWAVAAAIMLSWKNEFLITPDEAARMAGTAPDGERYINKRRRAETLRESHQLDFSSKLGMRPEPPALYGIYSYLDFLQNYGPLWIQNDRDRRHIEFTHFIVVYGIYGDGSDNGTFVKIMDPQGGPREQVFSDFVSDYERLAIEANENNFDLLIQIFHF